MSLSEIMRSIPYYQRIPFEEKTIPDGGSAVDTVTIPDNFLWMGLSHSSSVHSEFAMRIKDLDRSEYLPADGNYVVAKAWAGVGQRPFWFPAPRLLRRNSKLKLEMENYYVGSDTNATIVLLGLVVDESMASDWACADMGYVAYASDDDTNSHALWSFAASSITQKAVEMMTAFDFGLSSITGFAVGNASDDLELKITDPMNCPRDKTLVSRGFDIDVDPAPYEALVGNAQYPHYLLSPYPFMSQGAINVRVENTSAASTRYMSMMFHGAKLPRGNDDLLKKTIDWLNRYAVRCAR